jgi:hypothetical protein
MTIAPIETTWDGFRFRSRTEARWAVAFHAAGKNFDYEREGYDLPSGWYLPDFWLSDLQCWFEVKGVSATAREVALCRELARKTGHRVVLAVGPPDPKTYFFKVYGSGGEEGDELLSMPERAYQAARSERFDGKPVKRTTSTPEGIAAARRLAERVALLPPKPLTPAQEYAAKLRESIARGEV